jgi:hypothetical protein
MAWLTLLPNTALSAPLRPRLCGTQKSGDAYVRACLETIVADPR